MDKNLLKQLKASPLVTQQKLTREELLEERDNFQNILSKFIFPDDEYDQIHVDDIKCQIAELCRKNNLTEYECVQQTLSQLNYLHKETSIIKSGEKGEKILQNELTKCRRPSTYIFNNLDLYDTESNARTEIDSLVLTDDGIIFFEAKRVKSAVELTKDGRLVFADGACNNDRTPIVDNMRLKKELLTKMLKDLGINFNFKIESYITIVPKSQSKCRFTDNYNRQPTCYVEDVLEIIENFHYYAPLKSEQLLKIYEALTKIKNSKIKQFSKFDYKSLLDNLEQVVELLDSNKKEENNDSVKNNNPKSFIKNIKKSLNVTNLKFFGITLASFGALAGATYMGINAYTKKYR